MSKKRNRAGQVNLTVHREYDTAEPMPTVVSSSHGMKWDAKGRCYEQHGDGRRRGRWKRAPGKDFGTPFGDLVIPPWAQQAVSESRKSQRKRKPQ